LNEHKAIMLGSDIPNEATIDLDMIGTDMNNIRESKYIETSDIERDYGRKMLFMTPLEREVAFNLAEGVRHVAIGELLDIDTL